MEDLDLTDPATAEEFKMMEEDKFLFDSGVRGKDKDKDWLVEEKDRFDNELDTNKDNVLTKEEIMAWIIPSNEDIAKEEVDHLFAGADEDMNEFLTFEEVIKNHELFVGSEATDYGEHLTKLHKFEDEL